MRVARTRRVAVLLASLVFAVSACAGAGDPVDLADVDSVDRPTPVGARVNPPPPTTSAADVPSCGDPEASFRPLDPMPAPLEMPEGSTMRRIQDAGQLVAGVDQNTFLFGFRNPQTNAIEGFDIDRVYDIARAIFGDVPRIQDKVRFKVLTSKGRIDALKEKQVDIVVRTFTANCERWRDVNFSTIYYVAHQRLLVDTSSEAGSFEDLAGEKVCAASGSTSIKRIAEEHDEVVPVEVDNWTDCLVMLQQGQVAAVSTDDVILAGLAAQDPTVRVVGDQLHPEPYGVGIPKDAKDMVQFVNGVLEESVESGTWRESYDRWLAEGLGGSAEPPAPKYRD